MQTDYLRQKIKLREKNQKPNNKQFTIGNEQFSKACTQQKLNVMQANAQNENVNKK